MEMERVQLWFAPGDRREGFKWSAVYDKRMVGVCNQPFCEICDLGEREKLKSFAGGNLEIQLTLHRRPDFWEERQFYLGHLVRVLPSEAMAVDEGIEYDVSGSNAFFYLTLKGGVLVDPGVMGFDSGGENPFLRLIGNQRIVATIITHGHQDHWNNISALRPRGAVFMPFPAFQLASRHASQERDFHLQKLLGRARKVIPGEPIFLEQNFPLRIDTVPLPHSIPETAGLVIKGERARVVHLGDFKFNGMDSQAKAKTIALLSEIAKEKVDLLVLNIINAHIPGFTPLEDLVIESFTDIISRAEGRAIIACFSTNLERIRRIAEVAQLLGRRVEFFGAGMRNSQDLLGFCAREGDPDKAVIFVTGCQAEEKSVLWQITKGKNPPFELRPDDTVVSSARCIPGNEEVLEEQYRTLQPMVERLILHKGEISQLGLEDLKIEERFTHVTGHGSQEDYRLALEILRPEKVLPWPQISPHIEAFREIVPPGIEILDEQERVIEV